MLVFQILDPFEIEFPFKDQAVFHDMESPESVMVDPRSVRRNYREAIQQHLKDLAAVCVGSGVDYARFTTDTPLDMALARFLSWRQVRNASWR